MGFLGSLFGGRSRQPVTLDSSGLETLDIVLVAATMRLINESQLNVRGKLRMISNARIEAMLVAYGLIRVAWMTDSRLDGGFREYQAGCVARLMSEQAKHMATLILGRPPTEAQTKVNPTTEEHLRKGVLGKIQGLDEAALQCSKTNPLSCSPLIAKLLLSTEPDGDIAVLLGAPVLELLTQTRQVLTGATPLRAFSDRVIGPPAARGFIGVVDVENFDFINETLGRKAGDQVLAAYCRIVATAMGHDTFLKEAGFRAWVQLANGETVPGAGELKSLVAGKKAVACRPFSSGDEFFFHLADEGKTRAFLWEVQAAANKAEIPIRNENGLVSHVLQGLPLTIGAGPTWDDAWRALQTVRAKSGRVATSMKDRLRAASVSEQVVRDGPGIDPETGLPSTIDVVTEETADGAIPVLMWGPVEVRRPGWTDAHQEEMRWAIARLAVSKGIADPQAIVSLVVEVTELRNTVWSAIGEAIRQQSKL